MRVPAGEEVRGRRAGKQYVELSLRRLRKEDVDVGSRRAVETEHRPVADRDADRRRQRLQVRALVRRQHPTRPRDHVAEAARRVAASRRQAVEQPAFRVAPDSGAIQLAKTLDDFPRLRPSGGNVAETNDVVDVVAHHVCEDGVERNAVAVDVADEGKTSHERLASERAAQTSGSAAMTSQLATWSSRIR